jgi:hypothetical protein
VYRRNRLATLARIRDELNLGVIYMKSLHRLSDFTVEDFFLEIDHQETRMAYVCKQIGTK